MKWLKEKNGKKNDQIKNRSVLAILEDPDSLYPFLVAELTSSTTNSIAMWKGNKLYFIS